MGVVVIGALVVIVLFVIVVGYIYIATSFNNAKSVIIDNRELHETSLISYDSELDTFLCQLSAMWVERDYLEHHFITCFDENSDKEANKKAINILLEYFDVTDNLTFKNKLEDCLSDLDSKELVKFVKFLANQKILNENDDETIIKEIMAEYQHSKITTQFYNLKDNTNEPSCELFMLFDVSMAAFILRLSVYVGYCSEELFAKYRIQIFEQFTQPSIDWTEYYHHWLLADLFYAGSSFHSPYSINLRGIQKRVNGLVYK